MQHLKMEEIARLVEEAPDAVEGEHLAECDRCAGALRAMIAQTGALAELPDPAVPPRLRGRVVAAAAEARPGSRFRRHYPVARLAAALAIFLAGGVAGAFATTPSQMAEAPREERDPAAALVAAEAEYLAALASYSERVGPDAGFNPIHRLAALEGIVLTTRSALREAPADPIINNYHLTALGQRDALLRALTVETEEEEWF